MTAHSSTCYPWPNILTNGCSKYINETPDVFGASCAVGGKLAMVPVAFSSVCEAFVVTKPSCLPDGINQTLGVKHWINFSLRFDCV